MKARSTTDARPLQRSRPDSLPDAPGLPARRAAAAAVAAVLRGGGSLDGALKTGELPAADAALARAIATATFRRFGTIWAALAARVPKALPSDPDAVAILATGAAQILVLDVPDHAAVDLAVRLAAAEPSTRHLTGLVNALLRRIARERDPIEASSPPLADLPAWLRRRWSASYGPDRTAAIAAAHRAGAALDLTVKSDGAGWAERLGGSLLPTGSVRVASRQPVESLPGYGEGAWWVQDTAAALPARLLDVRPGERVLDLCAAPGGKTAQLAAAGAHVTALDRSEPRLRRLAANMRRLGLDAHAVHADALAYDAEPFDAVLIDAPCTATGTVRRHPDIAWAKREADIGALARLQRHLLDKAVSLTRPGGRLVYCVCSLEPEEGEAQARAALVRHPGLRRRPVIAEALGLGPGFVDAAGDLRTVPDMRLTHDDRADGEERAGLDGFFAAQFVREAG